MGHSGRSPLTSPLSSLLLARHLRRRCLVKRAERTERKGSPSDVGCHSSYSFGSRARGGGRGEGGGGERPRGRRSGRARDKPATQKKRRKSRARRARDETSLSQLNETARSVRRKAHLRDIRSRSRERDSTCGSFLAFSVKRLQRRFLLISKSRRAYDLRDATKSFEDQSYRYIDKDVDYTRAFLRIEIISRSDIRKYARDNFV